MDAALGWKTEKTDRALTLRLPAVSEGEYQRICSLLEKTVYGGIMLEPFEERALDRFLYHLTGQDMKKSLGMWLKLHYACLKKRNKNGNVLRTSLRAFFMLAFAECRKRKGCAPGKKTV